MLKKFFIAMGVIFTGLIASCSLFVGFNAANDAPKNKAVAEAITRELAREWNVKDIEPLMASSAANQTNFGEAQLGFNKLKPLGSLKKVEEAQQTEFNVEKNIGQELTKSATVTMVAEFENGRANVTMALKSEHGKMKLWRVNVTPIGDVRSKGQPV